jgi:hypothetical protein
LIEARTCAFHNGDEAVATTADGRSHKRRVQARLNPIVDAVAMVKDGQLQPAANIDGFAATYQQSYRAIDKKRSDVLDKSVGSFQLIIPYLQTFLKLNPGSTTKAEMDRQNNIVRLYVCAGMMIASLRFVRPVMSLDAAHLKSKWKGNLYIASVKTACDELYPFAFAIVNENENANGWKWFLELLRSSL